MWQQKGNKSSHCTFSLVMSPQPSPIVSQSGFGQTVRLPRESDGVGSALRQIFGGAPATSAEFSALLNRLDKQD